MEANKVKQAINLAKFAHEGQRYGDDKYIVHLKGVADIASRSPMVGDVGLSEVLQVSYLHDILEDTAIKFGLLYEFFSADVCEAVRLLTKREDIDYEQYINNIKKNKLATVVKIADTLYNLQQSALNKNHKRIEKYTKQLQLLTN